MTTLICKMCGGSIELTGESHGRCDSCGCEVTLPKIDDSKRADMYNRGNHFRTIGDFDKAYSAYEHIIADDQSDAEAHWCLMLCRYGVEYVKDARTGDYKPTVSRMSFDPVLEDPDYLAALAASDEYTKEIYRREARKIENIQKQYLEISRKEAPYDVFICFKAEEPTGGRTRASEIGQDIYERLTEKGVKTFFSRITLEDKLTEAYEPYIFAALNSAKVMLVVANKPEQLEARWVKNEWTRYLNMMDKDRNKHILPVFEGMSPYDFPQEIPMVQGQDMAKVGAMQDLIRGICKITGHLYEQQVGQSPTAVQASAVGGIMVRAKQSLEDGEYPEAIRLLEEALNRDPDYGEAYYYYFLANHRIQNLPRLVSSEQVEWVEERYFKRAQKHCDGIIRAHLEQFSLSCQERKQLDRAKALCDAQQYQEAQSVLTESRSWAQLQPSFESNTSYREQLLNAAAQGKEQQLQKQQKEKQREIWIKEYRAEIGDPTQYIPRLIEKNHPAEYAELKKKELACEKAHKKAFATGGSFLAITCSLLILGYGLLLIKYPIFPILEGVLFMGFAIHIALSRIVFRRSFSALISIAATLLTLFGLCFLLDMGTKYLVMGGKAYCVLGAVLLLGAFWRKGKTKKYREKEEDLDIYVKETIIPLQEEICTDVENRWKSKVGIQNMVELTGLYQLNQE